jgi:hypothetical protein
MNDKMITDLIRQIHGALADSRAVSRKDRELLEQLSAELDALLAEPGAAERARHRNITERLLTAVTRFEASHPDLTTTMNQVSKALADMGI